MTQRKMFLFLGLGINLLFYVVVSLGLYQFYTAKSRELELMRPEQLLKIERAGLWQKQAIATEFLNQYYQNKWSPESAKPYAKALGITAANSSLQQQVTPLIADQAREPIPGIVFESTQPSLVFHKNKEGSYLTFLILPRENFGFKNPHTVTFRFDLKALPDSFSNFDTEITVIENAWGEVSIIESTLPEHHQTKLKESFDFKAPLPTPLDSTTANSNYVRADFKTRHDQYYLYSAFLTNTVDFKQAIIYSLKINQLVIFNSTAALLLVTLMFIISVAAIFAAYLWSRD